MPGNPFHVNFIVLVYAEHCFDFCSFCRSLVVDSKWGLADALCLLKLNGQSDLPSSSTGVCRVRCKTRSCIGSYWT